MKEKLEELKKEMKIRAEKYAQNLKAESQPKTSLGMN